MSDCNYIRPYGGVLMLPKISQNWFGYGSREGIEMFECLTQTGKWGATSFSRGVDPNLGLPLPDICFSEERYLALYPKVDNLDSRKTQWGNCPNWKNTVGPKAWGEARTAVPPVRYRIIQNDATPNRFFSRRSLFRHAPNASFAIHYNLPEPPPDSDYSQGQPFCGFAWGEWRWAILVYAKDYPMLVEWTGSGWVARKRLPKPPTSPESQLTGENIILVQHLRGAIFISLGFMTDQPETYSDAEEFYEKLIQRKALAKQDEEYFYRPDTPYWPSGHFDVFGFSSQVAFGVSTISYPLAGAWTSQPTVLPQPRGGLFGFDAPLYYQHWQNHNGGIINYTTLNSTFDNFFQYRITLQPYTIKLDGKRWWRSPDVEGVGILYGARPIPGVWTSGDNGQMLNGRIESCSIEKPEELGESIFTADLLFPDGIALVTGDWRETPIKVFLGRDGDQNDPRLRPVFTGYITEMSATMDGPSLVRATLTAHSTSLRPKRMRFGKWTMPRGGLYLNQILNIFLQVRGIPLEDALWHPDGWIIRLPAGPAEDPSFWPDPEGDAWDWHKKLCEYHGLDLLVTDDGYYATKRNNYFEPTPFFWRAFKSFTLDDALVDLTSSSDVLDTFTRLIVFAKTPRGEAIVRWAINYAAEQNPNYRGFRPWPEEHKEKLDLGPLEPYFVNFTTVNMALNLLLPKLYGEWQGEFNPDIGRHDLVRIFNDPMQAEGVYVVQSLRHNIPAGPDFRATTTIKGFKYV